MSFYTTNRRIYPIKIILYGSENSVDGDLSDPKIDYLVKNLDDVWML